MPTKKNRCTITFEDANYSALKRLSEDTGQSMSSLVNEMFSLLLPSLAHISAAKRMVEEGLVAAGDQAFRGFLQGLTDDFNSQMSEAESLWSESVEPADERTETPEGERRRAS